MMQSRLFLHSDIDDKLLYVRPKNDCKKEKHKQKQDKEKNTIIRDKNAKEINKTFELKKNTE